MSGARPLGSPLGIFARAFPARTAAELAATVSAHGFDCVQLNLVALGWPSIPDPATLAGLPLEQVATAFRRVGVEIWGLSATYNMAHPDPARRRRETAAAAALIAAAPRLGAGAVSLCTGSRDPEDQWRAHPDNAGAAAWKDMLDCFGPLLGAAAPAGIRLAVEPEPANVVSDADRALRLLDALGERGAPVGLILDPANLVGGAPPAQREAILRDAFARLGDRTVCMHAKDVVSWAQRLAGAPGLDLGLIAALRAALPRSVPLIIQDTDPDQAGAVRELLRAAAANTGQVAAPAPPGPNAGSDPPGLMLQRDRCQSTTRHSCA